MIASLRSGFLVAFSAVSLQACHTVLPELTRHIGSETGFDQAVDRAIHGSVGFCASESAEPGSKLVSGGRTYVITEIRGSSQYRCGHGHMSGLEVYVRAVLESDITDAQLAEARTRWLDERARRRDQLASQEKAQEDRRVAGYHHAGTVGSGDVIPAGELYVDIPVHAVPVATRSGTRAWLLVNLAVPTPRGGKSYKVSVNVNCDSGVLEQITYTSQLLDREYGFGNPVFGDAQAIERRIPSAETDKPSKALASAASHICK